MFSRRSRRRNNSIEVTNPPLHLLAASIVLFANEELLVVRANLSRGLFAFETVSRQSLMLPFSRLLLTHEPRPLFHYERLSCPRASSIETNKSKELWPRCAQLPLGNARGQWTPSIAFYRLAGLRGVLPAWSVGSQRQLIATYFHSARWGR